MRDIYYRIHYYIESIILLYMLLYNLYTLFILIFSYKNKHKFIFKENLYSNLNVFIANFFSHLSDNLFTVQRFCFFVKHFIIRVDFWIHILYILFEVIPIYIEIIQIGFLHQIFIWLSHTVDVTNIFANFCPIAFLYPQIWCLCKSI